MLFWTCPTAGPGLSVGTQRQQGLLEHRGQGRRQRTFRPSQPIAEMEAQWAEEHRAGGLGGAVVVEGSPEEITAERAFKDK